MKEFNGAKHTIGIFLILIIFISCKESSSKRDNGQSYVQESGSVQQPTYAEQEQARLENLRIEMQKAEEEKKQLQRQQYILAINKLLAEDDEVGRITNKDYITTAPKMRQLDISKCPTDFAAAYIRHIQAWEKGAEVKQAYLKLKEYSDLVLVARLLQPITGAKDEAFEDYEAAETEIGRLAKEAEEEVKSTWRDIEYIAVGYGATMPK